jgi:hypothetical protein
MLGAFHAQQAFLPNGGDDLRAVQQTGADVVAGRESEHPRRGMRSLPGRPPNSMYSIDPLSASAMLSADSPRNGRNARSGATAMMRSVNGRPFTD